VQLALCVPLGALSLPESVCRPAVTLSQRKTAVCLLVQYALSGALRGDTTQCGFDHRFGNYEGELKPAKRADKLKGGERESAKLSAEAVRSAVEAYQNSVLVSDPISRLCYLIVLIVFLRA
jgi:hypothetical protein